MKLIDEFRDRDLAHKVATAIARAADTGRRYRLMEFCGGHTHAIFRYALQDLLPSNIEMVHGPGCPVCVLPVARLDSAIDLARNPDVILCSYGDMLRVPASGRTSLLQARATGADIRMVYSCAEALKIASDYPDKEVVFFAIGFETTTPPTAVVIQQAVQLGLKNFSVFSNHVLTPAAMTAILESPEQCQAGSVAIDGFVGPAHVSTVIGYRPYEPFAKDYHKPVVIAGFEPLDLMQAILMLIRQLNEGRHQVENEYTRAVSRDGNIKAQQRVAEVFVLRSEFEWRGLGTIPNSALQIRSAYSALDAERRFELPVRLSQENKACDCPAILRGVKNPRDCRLFGNGCTPETPQGACMVSSEGACAAYWNYGRARQSSQTTPEAKS